MDRARRSHRQLEALIAKLEDRMASLEQRESELQYDLNTNSLPYLSGSDDPSSSDRLPPRPTSRPRTNPERGGYQRAPQSRNFIDLLEDEIRRFQLEKQEADIKWQKRQKELFTQLQSIRSDFLPEPESSRSVDSIQSTDIENIQRLNRLAEEVSQKKRKVAELERQLEEKVKQTQPISDPGVVVQRAPGQALRPRLSSTSLAQLHRIMRELENFICAIEEEDYNAPDQVPSEGPRTAPSAMGGDDVTKDMIRVQQKEIENLKEQLALVTNNYLAAKQESENMRQELNELKTIVLGESSEPKVVAFADELAEADSEPPPPPPESQEAFLDEESESKLGELIEGLIEEEVTKEVEGTEEEAAPTEDEVYTGGEEAAPTEEEAVPAEEEAVPSEEEAVPAEEEAAPTEEEAALPEEEGEEAVPAEEEAVPAEEEAVPAEEEAALAEEEGEGEAVPAEEEAALAEEGGEEAVPAEEEAALAEEGGEEAVPAEEEAIPAEEEAVAAEEEAAPAEEEEGEGEAVPAEEEAVAAEEEAAPAEEEGEGEAVPAEEEAAPTEEGEEEAVPAEEEAAPTEEGEEEVVPAEEEAAPPEEEAAPAEDEVSTGGEEAAPTEEEAAAAEEEAAPIEEEAAPAEEEAVSAEEEAVPAEEEAVPVEEEAAPAEEEAVSAEEEAAPAEEKSAPAKRPICKCPTDESKKKRPAPCAELVAPSEEEAVPVEEDVLADEETAPAEEEAAPADDEISTGGEEAVPTEEEEVAPVEEEAASGGEEAAPTEEETIPTEEEAVPVEEEAAPVEEEASPVEEEAAAGGEEAAPFEEGAASPEEPVVISEEGPEAGTVNDDEDEDEDLVFLDVSKECCCPDGQCVCCLAEGLESCRLLPIEKHECVTPGDAEAPEVHEQGSSEPIIVEDQLLPEEEAVPAEEEAAPAEDEVSTGGEEAAPTEEEAAPAEEEAAPVEEEAAPAEEEAAPAEEEAAPVEEEAAPAEEEAAPVEEEAAPAEEEAAPVEEEAAPAEEEAAPVEEEAAPAEEEAAPAEEEAAPAEEEAAPTEEEAVPAEETTPYEEEEQLVEEKPTEELPQADLKCLCGQSNAAMLQPGAGAGDRPVPEEIREETMEPAVQEPSKPDASERSVQKIPASGVDIVPKFSEEGAMSVAAGMLLDIAARVTAERSADNVEDLTRALEAELEGKEYSLTNDDIQKILEDIIDSYTQYPSEKEVLAGEIKKIVEDVIQRDVEPSDEKERVAEDIQTILEGIMQRYSVFPMGEGEPEDAKTEVPMKVTQPPKPVAQVSSGKEPYSLRSSTSDLGCQVLCWDDSAFAPVTRQTSSSSDLSCKVLCWKEQVGDEEARVPAASSKPVQEAESVEEMVSDQPMDSEDKTEPLDEIDTDQTVDSEDQAEPVEEADAEQLIESEEPVDEVAEDEPVDSEDKAEPVDEVNTDQTVDSEDKTEPVEEVSSDQPEDSEEKTEPSEEADKDQPVESGEQGEGEGELTEDSQETPLQEEIPSAESTSGDVVGDEPGEDEVKTGLDEPAPECVEECYCTEPDELLVKDEIPPTESPATDVVRDEPGEVKVAEDSQEMPLQEEIPSSESPTGDKPTEGDESEDLQGETDERDAHRLEKVSSSTTQTADEFPLQNQQLYRIEKITSSLQVCAFEFGTFRDNAPGGEETIREVSSVSPESGADEPKITEEMGDEASPISPEGGINEMEEREDGSVAPEIGDLNEEGSPTAPEVTAEDAGETEDVPEGTDDDKRETEDGSEQVSPIDHEGSVDMKETEDGGEEVSPIIPESGTDETKEREGVSEEVVIAPEGGVDESDETPQEIYSTSSKTGGGEEILEPNIVDENTVSVQEQILEPVPKKDCKCSETTQEWKPIADEIVEKPETTDEVVVDEKADDGIEEKSECIGKENCICSDSVEELFKKESEFTEESPTITSSPDDAIISECGIEDMDLEGKESKEDTEIDKRIESEKALLEEEQPGDSVEVMVVNHTGGEDEFIEADSEKLDETEVSYDGDTESDASDIEQSEDAQPKTDTIDDFETVFKKEGIEDIDLICECSDVCLTDYSSTSTEDDDSEYDTALSCPDHDELFTEESYHSDTEPTPKGEYMEEIEIDVVVEKGGGGKPYDWNKGSYDAVNFEGEILFNDMSPHETTSEDSAARVSIDSVLEADDEGQETANEVDQQVMFHYEGVRDILVGEVVPKDSRVSIFIPATPSKVQPNPILQQNQPMTRVSQDNQEQGEPAVKTSNSKDSKKRPSSGASKERVRESSIDRKRRWSKVKEEDSDLRVQINELNKRMAVKSKMLLDMEANLNALKGGGVPKEQKLPLTKSAMAMVFAAIRDGIGALSCRCFMGGSPPPQPPCAPTPSCPLGNSHPYPCASCCFSSQEKPPVFPCEIKCPFHMPPPPCNRWLLQRPPCSLPPGPGELVARRVDNDSLLLRWGASRNPSVTGFDIYVNGTVVHRVRGPGRSIAMLTGLNLTCRTVICVYAMTPSGTYGNPMSTVYQPPASCPPCCKMRENGDPDKCSRADIQTHGSRF